MKYLLMLVMMFTAGTVFAQTNVDTNTTRGGADQVIATQETTNAAVVNEPSHSKTIAIVNCNYIGSLALDGYVSIMDILISFAKDKNAKGTDIEDIIKAKYGKKYQITNITVKTIEDSSTTVPSYRLNTAALDEINKKDYFLIVVTYYRWQEHTKYKYNSWDNPPLKMDIAKFYEVRPFGKEVKYFSYKSSHEEPSEYSKEKEQKSARKKTAAGLVVKQKELIKEIKKALP